MDKRRLDPEMVANAQRAIETPEVQEMLRRLAAHGLGVFLPHIHLSTGEFAPQPPHIVAIESDLKVSFVPDTDPSLSDAVPVGWYWDDAAKQVLACVQCSKTYHH